MSDADIDSEDLSVSHARWGKIFVHNKRPAGVDSFGPDRIVIMQHGATYGSSAFSLRFGGLSWMDYIAARGFDVYCLDLPGYGKSRRPPSMAQPARDNPPFMHTPDAADCLASVVEFICERRDVERVCLVGWSWGTAISGYLATQRPERVERLTLYAPVWDRNDSGPSAIHVEGALGAYRTVSREATIARRRNGLDPEQALAVMPAQWFDQWWDETARCDPHAEPGTIRAPNGVVEDSRNYWSVGKRRYDASQITCPVLLVVGEWDRDTEPKLAIALFTEIGNAPWKRLSILSGGTHAMLMEANRMLLFRSVQQFLEEPPPGVSALA